LQRISDGVVTLSAGASYFDGSQLIRHLLAYFRRRLAQRFQHLLLAAGLACSFASTSPLRQFTAFSPTTYWLPSGIVPSDAGGTGGALADLRANSRVRRAS